MSDTPQLPWLERLPMLSINPDAATRDDVAQMAAELMERRRDALVIAKRLLVCETCLRLYHEAWHGAEGDWRTPMKVASDDTYKYLDAVEKLPPAMKQPWVKEAVEQKADMVT